MEIKYSLMRANATAPKSWVEGTDCCLWDHVRCKNHTARVSELSVTSFFGFQWKLNFSVFSSFKELTSLDLSHNDFDTSPSLEGISQLTKLQYLNLGYNGLAGNIPLYLGNISSLQILNLEGNLLRGSLPNEVIRNLPNLRELYLTSNRINGSLPTSLFELRHLEHVHIFGNLFEGNIPRGLFSNLTSLRSLDLSDNDFDGHFSFLELANLSMFTEINLSNNNNLAIQVNYPGCEIAPSLQLKLLIMSSSPGYSDYFWELTNEFNMIGIDSSWEDVSIDVVYSTHDDLQHFSFATKGSFYNFSTVFFGLLSGVDLSRNKFSGLIPPGIRNTNPIKFLALHSVPVLK
ncbi:Receptor-like protein 12 [Rhynchospora pubera]|uniref:Receptor-like protein 12 n=1 Tax=Rhynchospora pubera TaxID=906938 RepID=A0AAV8CZ59_9POAL|nr:Receptor-like protein 12 [Rhynchospora pubera]